MTPSKPLRTRRRSPGLAWLALAAWLVAVLTAAPARADHAARDIVVRLRGIFLDQTEKKVVARLDLTLPLHEWVDRQGEVKLEPRTGTGTAVVRGLDGRDEEIAFTARLTRFAGPPQDLPDGSRRWSLRGDLYLQARGRALVETEFCPELEVPPPGQTRTYEAPETWPEGDGAAEELGRAMLKLSQAGRGGGVIHGRDLWVRPVPAIPLLGVVHVIEVGSKPSAAGTTEREADQLLNRIQYVAADYARAVRDGQITNDLEYGEQVRLLQEASILADRLGVTEEARRLLVEVRKQVDWRSSPVEVAALCKRLEAELLATLGLLLSSPLPSSLAEVAPIYRAQCAACHGESGDGRGPSARDLEPPPRSFLDPAETAGMTPHRAYMALTSGVPGTAMAAFEEAIPLEQRWALAFYVLSLRHTDRSAAGLDAGRAVSLSLDELATSTDEALAARAAKAGDSGAAAEILAYFRSASGVEAAAASPFEPIRRDLRAAVSGEAEDAAVPLDRAQQALSALLPEVRRRDEAAADEAAAALDGVQKAVSSGAADTEIRRSAWSAFPALRRAELALQRPAPKRFLPGLAALLGLAAMAFIVLFTLAARRTSRLRAGTPSALASTSGSPS